LLSQADDLDCWATQDEILGALGSHAKARCIAEQWNTNKEESGP
jgi:hypothetical protein